jgi:hypothetical protein
MKVVKNNNIYKFQFFAANANAARRAQASLNANQNDYANANQNGRSEIALESPGIDPIKEIYKES